MNPAEEPQNNPLESLDSGTDSLDMPSTSVGGNLSPNPGADLAGPNDNTSYQRNGKNIFSNISPRTVMIVSTIITLIVLLITSFTALVLTRNQPDQASSNIPTQDVDLGGSDGDLNSEIFSGKENALFVNGDIIADQSLIVNNNGYAVVIKPADLSEDRTITLPNASGTVCLSSNNCNFATGGQLQELSSQLGQILTNTNIPDSSLVNDQIGAVSIQGTSNRISVSTSNGVIRLSTPQDIAKVSSPTFSNLVLTGNLSIDGTLTLPLNCTTFLNGGSLTTNSSGRIICADDETSGGGTSVTTPGGTAGTIPLFTSADVVDDSIITQALGTITIGGSLSVSNNVTFSNLANGFLRVNGSGVVSVDTIDLGTDTNGNYVSNLTAGNGINVGGVAGEGWSPIVSVAVQSNKGLEVDVSGLSLIDCSNGQILKYNGSNQWACAADSDTTSTFSIDADAGTPETVNDGDTVNFSGGNNITTSVDPTDTITIDTVNNPNFTVSVTTPLLQSSGALSITPGGALSVGATGQTALLQGSTTTITSNGAGNDIVLTSADQVRLTGFNCTTFDNGGALTTDASGNISCQNDDGDPPNGVIGSGTTNRLAIFTGPQAIGDSWILQNGSTLELDASHDLSLLGGNFSVVGTGLFSGLVTANGGLTVQAGDTFTFNGDAFTDLTGTGLVISTGSLQTTLGTSVDLGAEVNGTLPIANGGTGLGGTPTNGQLLIGNGTGYTLATLTQGAGMTITNGVGSITVASAFGASVDLGVDTTGDYVEDITAGNGLTGSASGAGSNPILALGPLTGDWNQTGAFDVVLNNASSELRILESAGGTFFGRLDVGDLTADRTYTLPDDDGEVCLVEAGNCAGSGTGVTSSGGTTNRLAKFTSGQNIEDSALSEDGTNVTVLGSVDLIVQGGDATLGTAVQDGSLTIYNNGFGALVQASLTGPQTYTLPDGSGEVCIKEFGNCSGGGGGNAPVSAQYLTLALDGTLTAERVLAFNGTNFSVADGGANGSYSVNTIQNINAGATPSFAGLTLTGNLSVAANTISGTTAVIDFTDFDVAANGNTTVGGTLDVSGLTNLTGGLTVQNGDTFTFNGDAFTDLTGTGLTISTGSLQTTLGTSVDLTAEVNGVLPILNGGTGANSQQSAINNLSGLTIEGDLLFFDGADSTRLARGSNGQCLTSTATSLLWSSCTAGAITGLTLAGTSGVSQAIANGDTITIAAGSNITTTGVATDTVTVAVVSSPTFSGTVTANAFVGDGSALTDLDADELTSGTVDTARITGDYTGITGVGTLNAGSIGPSFGSIDTGSDDITTTGTISGGNVTVSGSQFTNNGSTLNTAQSLGDFPSGGAIGSAATTVDVDTSFAIAQTTAAQTLSLPNPTSATAGRIVFVLNTGSASFTMHGVTIPAGYGQIYVWNGSTWILGASGGGSAITLQAAYNGGNTLTSTNARDIDFTLANTASDANFTIDIASGSTGEFQIEAAGTDILQIGSAGQLQLDVQGSSGGILLGGDANLYRDSAAVLRTDGSLWVRGAGGLMVGGSGSDEGIISLDRGDGSQSFWITNINDEIRSHANGGNSLFTWYTNNTVTTIERMRLDSNGQLQLHTQGNTGGLLIGTDASLYRSAADTLTGETLNATTGINTGASAGTQRIDSSGNLVNIGNLTTTGASTFTSTGANGFTFKPGTDNSTAFRIQNAGGTTNLLVADTTNTRLGVGTASPNTTLSVYNSSESVTQTDFTQALNKGGINIVTDFTDGAYTPGIFWSTQDNNATKPKAGIYMFEDGTFGTSLLFGTSGSFATGITNTALTLGPSGSAIFKNGSDSSTGFQVKNSSNAGLLTVNTSTNSVIVSSLFIDTLGSANTDDVLCHNSSDQVATCNSTFVTTAGLTLQSAYDGGGTITTANNKDLAVTLANTATDSNFRINIATSSTSEFQVESNGTDILQIGAAGQLQLDVQGSSGGILIGGDVQLYRSSANRLELSADDSFRVTNTGGERIGFQSDVTGVYLDALSSSASDWVVSSKVSGDANPRFTQKTDGTLEWGDGTATQDTNLYRSGVGELRTDNDFYAGSEIGLNDDGILSWGGNGFSTSIQAADNGGSSYMQFQINGTPWLAVGANGSAYFQRASDASDAFEILNSTGDSVLTVSTTAGNYLGGVGDLQFHDQATLSFGANTVAGEDTNGDFHLDVFNGGLISMSTDNALRVQDTGGVATLEVDTTNNRVAVGTSVAGDYTGTMLNIFGAGGNGSAGRITFGDYLDTSDENVFVGEYGTTDTDILQLSGKSGIHLTTGGVGSNEVLSFDADGHAVFQAADDDTSVFQVQDSSGDVVLNLDTLNALLEVDDSGGASGESYISFNNRAVFGYDGATSDAIVRGTSGKGIRFYVDDTNNSLALDAGGGATFTSAADAVYFLTGNSGTRSSIQIGRTAEEFLLGVASTSGQYSNDVDTAGDAVIRTESATAKLILQNGNAGGNIILDNGNTVIKPTTDSSAAFKLQTSNGTDLLTADTTNKKVSVVGDVNVGTRYANRLFSDNFEIGTTRMWDGGDTGSVSISTSTVHGGKYSARINPSGSQANVYTSIAPSTTVYSRAWVRVASQTSGTAEILILEADGPGYWKIERTGGNLHFYNGVTSTDTNSGTALSTGAWHLIEMRVTTGAGSGTSQVWLDGTQVVNLTSQNNGTDDIVDFAIGDTNNDTFDLFVDDVSVDTVTTGTSSSLHVDDTLHVGGNAAFGGKLLVQSSTPTSQIEIRRGVEADGENGIRLSTNDGYDWKIYQAKGSSDLSFWGDNLGDDILTLNANDGSALFQNTTDSTDALRVNYDDGTRLFTVDTTNGNVAIGDTLDAGNELYVQSNSDTVIRGKNTGSADLLQLANNTTDVLVVNNAGQLQLSTQGNTGGVQIGGDTLLYRSNTNEMSLGSNDSLVIPGGNFTSNDNVTLGSNGSDLTTVNAETVFANTANVSFASQTVTVTGASSTVTPTSSYVLMECNRAAGASTALTLSETGARDGQLLIITVRGDANAAGNCTIANSAGAQRTAAAGTVTLDDFDSIGFIYNNSATNQWIQLFTSNQ